MDDAVTYCGRARSSRSLGWLTVLALGLALSMPSLTVLRADESSFWAPRLGEVPEETASRTLIVILITNDVAEHWHAMQTQSRAKPATASWCQRPLARAITRIPASYSQPSAPILWQHWPLGLPAILTGGQEVDQAGRALLVVTDGHYRLLGLLAGVPEEDDLVELIQDAEDVRTLLHQSPEDPDRLVDQIAEHFRERLPRLWQIEIDQQLKALGKTPDDQIVNVINDNERFTEQVRLRVRLIAEQVRMTYLKDVQLRYGLTRADDQARLTVLEQHSATRKPWSLCILPFVAGADVRLVGNDLVDIVWRQHAMPVSFGDDESLAKWISRRDPHRPFALQIPLPAMEDQARVSVSETAARHGLGWTDLDTTVRESPIRETRLDELAAWLLHQRARPVDLQRPSNVRYLFFRSPSDRPFPIRDGDLPGPSITMIRQVQK